MLLIFGKRTIGDFTVESLKNICSQPSTVGYGIRTKADIVFGSTFLCENNNNKSMQNIPVFLQLCSSANWLHILYLYMSTNNCKVTKS